MTAMPVDARTHPRVGWFVARGLLLLGWLITAALGAVMLARVVAYDRGRLLLVANSLTYWIFLPEYVVLAVAIAARKYLLVACATVVVLAHVVVVWPSLSGPADIPQFAYQAPRLRLFVANVLFDNPHPEGIIDEIDRADPDVVMLEEFTTHWHRALERASWWDDYPYRLLAPRGTTSRSAILSRVPLEDTDIEYTDRSPLLEATVRVGGRAVRLIDVHPAAPVFSYPRWRAQSRAITGTIGATRGRVVAAGDFNVTQFNSWIEDLEALGLRSAHELLGDGAATTWPNGQGLFPPVRLDHVLVSAAVVPLRIRQGVGQGSDHRPVIVDLALTR
jgi:endonuclease/exonuclease/phosphatase (EEP) superfamily protein YafD